MSEPTMGRVVWEVADGTLGPVSGVVYLESRNAVRFPESPALTAVQSQLSCPVIDGKLCAPGATDASDPGVEVVASFQDVGLPDRVQWRAVFRLRGVVNPAPLVFDVPPGGTVDLTSVLPPDPGPGVVTVVLAEDRVLAEAARDEAVLAADVAEGARDEAVQSASAAAGAASSAAQSASAADGSAQAASASVGGAAESASTASAAASTATTARDEAVTARSGAVSARDQAETSAQAASGSAGSATSSAGVAAGHAGDAEQSATAAAGSATSATGSASAASTSAGAAEQSAADATESATAASASASQAAGSATAAAGSATTAQAAAQETIVAVSPLADWSGAVTIPQAQSRSGYLRRRLTGNVVLTLGAGVAGQAYTCTLDLSQDTSGGRTLTIRGALTAYAVAITLSTAANARDVIHLMWTGAEWIAMAAAPSVAIPTSWAV